MILLSLYNIFAVFIIIICILLLLIILVQNPQGGGLSSSFGSSNQILGVRKTADFLEKTTWTLIILLISFTIVSTWTNKTSYNKSILDTDIQYNTDQIAPSLDIDTNNKVIEP